MNSAIIFFAVVLLLFTVVMAVIALVIFIVVSRVKNRVQNFSQIAFGTDDIVEGLKRVDREAELTPKSLSSATSICLAKIVKDFPEFHYEEMKACAENLIVSYLTAIDCGDAGCLSEGTTDELKDKLDLKIRGLRSIGVSERYRDIKIHRTEIKNYSKEKGRCCVQFQSAVQYFYYREKNGKIVDGSGERLHQAKYETEMIFIQDRNFVENQEGTGMAMICPCCGAPLPKLGAKKCQYCDTPVAEFNIKIWNFNDIKEV